MIEQQEIQQQKKPVKNGGCLGIARNIAIIFLLISNILLIYLVYVYIVLQYPEGYARKHLANIPTSAVWHGGPDGGYFYDLVDIKDDMYRVRVYNDYTGDLNMDSDFKLEPFVITKDNFSESLYFCRSGIDSVGHIHLDVRMRHIAIYPAYGGANWEAIKEEYKLEY